MSKVQWLSAALCLITEGCGKGGHGEGGHRHKHRGKGHGGNKHGSCDKRKRRHRKGHKHMKCHKKGKDCHGVRTHTGSQTCEQDLLQGPAHVSSRVHPRDYYCTIHKDRWFQQKFKNTEFEIMNLEKKISWLCIERLKIFGKHHA